MLNMCTNTCTQWHEEHRKGLDQQILATHFKFGALPQAASRGLCWRVSRNREKAGNDAVNTSYLETMCTKQYWDVTYTQLHTIYNICRGWNMPKSVEVAIPMLLKPLSHVLGLVFETFRVV